MYWEGYNDGVKTHTSASLYGGVQQFVDLAWADVDYVKFVSTNYNHFIIDDLKYDNDAAPVPEPSTFLLLGGGLLGLGYFGRKRMKS